MERRALAKLGFYPDPSAALVHDALGDREADPRTWELTPVQPFEDSKNLFVIPRIDSDAVVLDGELDGVAGIDGRDMNPGRFQPAERDGVRNQLPKKLRQLCEVEVNGGQRIIGDLRAAGFDRRIDHQDGALERTLRLDEFKGLVQSSELVRIRKQIAQQALHALRSLDDIAHEVGALAV